MFIEKEGEIIMTEEKFKEILDKKETDTVEFKSWVNARNMKEIISLNYCRGALCWKGSIYSKTVTTGRGYLLALFI